MRSRAELAMGTPDSAVDAVDDGAKTGGPPFTFVAVAAGSVVDGRLDACLPGLAL